MMWSMIASAITGIVLGTFFVLSWRRSVGKICPSQFWNTLHQITGELLRVDATAELLQLYRRLFACVARYIAGNFIGLVIGLLPVVLLFYIVVPEVNTYRDREMRIVEVYPANVATLSQNGLELNRHHDAERSLYDLGKIQEGALNVNSTHIILDKLHAKTGICWSYWYCALLESFGFDLVELENAPTSETSYIVMRPDRSKYSLFWPMLNDIESLFLVAFLVTNILVFVADKRSSV